MKNKTYLIVLALGWLTASTWSAQSETVNWNQLPAAVQRTINEQRGPLGVASIERLDRSGASVYEVRLNGSGPDSRFVVTDAGTIVKLNDIISSPANQLVRELTFGALPIAVQNTIRSRVGDAPIQKIEMVTGNGQTSYVAPYRVGEDVLDLWVDPNGNVLATSPSRVLLTSPKWIRSDEVPAAVRDALRDYLGNITIEGVQKGLSQGRTVYETTVNRAGRKIDLRLAENGALIRDAINDRFLAETGRLPSPLATSGVSLPVRVPLADRTPVSFNQLPAAVIAAIQKYAGADFVEKIEKGTDQGQSVYQAVFRHAGETIPLRLGQNGSLIEDDVNHWAQTKLTQNSVVSGKDWRSTVPRATMADVRKLAFDQLPLAVQNTLRYYLGGLALQDLVQGTVNGSPVYQADAKVRGEDVKLRIADDGSPVDDQPNARFLSQFEQAPSAVGQAAVWQGERGGGNSSTVRP